MKINCFILIRQKRWDEQLERPDLDYSEIFGSAVGQIPGKNHHDKMPPPPFPLEFTTIFHLNRKEDQLATTIG